MMREIFEILWVMGLRPAFRWGLFFAGVGGDALLVLGGQPYLSTLWAMAFFYAGLHVEWGNGVLGTRTAFLLPGYGESLRRVVFLGALRTGLLCSLFLFSLSWDISSHRSADSPPPQLVWLSPNVLQTSVYLTGGCMASIALFLSLACLPLVLFRLWWSVSLGLGAGIFLTMISVLNDHLFLLWLVLIPLSVCICGYFWLRLGDPDWVRCRHRALISGVIDERRHVGFRTMTSSPAEDSLQTLLLDGGPGMSCGYLRGGLYRAFGPIILRWRGMLFAVVTGALILGYAGRMATDMAFMALGVTALWPVDLWGASNILLPEGCREKRRMVLVMAMGTSLTLLLIGAATMGISWLLNLLLPDFAFGRSTLDYSVIHPTGVYVACLLTPWVIVHRLLYPRSPALTNVGAWFLFGGLAIGSMFIHYGRALGWPWLADGIRVLLIPVLISGWVALLLVLSISSRQDFASLRVRAPNE